MSEIVSVTYIGKIIGYFPNRAEADGWISKLMDLANGPDRVNGGYASYSPLQPDVVEIAVVETRGVSIEDTQKILEGQFGGWTSEKTRAFIAERDGEK